MSDPSTSEEPQDELVRQELARAHAKRRKGRNRLIGIAVAVVVIGVTFLFLLPRIADYQGCLECPPARVPGRGSQVLPSR